MEMEVEVGIESKIGRSSGRMFKMYRTSGMKATDTRYRDKRR